MKHNSKWVANDRFQLRGSLLRYVAGAAHHHKLCGSLLRYAAAAHPPQPAQHGATRAGSALMNCVANASMARSSFGIGCTVDPIS